MQKHLCPNHKGTGLKKREMSRKVIFKNNVQSAKTNTEKKNENNDNLRPNNRQNNIFLMIFFYPLSLNSFELHINNISTTACYLCFRKSYLWIRELREWLLRSCGKIRNDETEECFSQTQLYRSKIWYVTDDENCNLDQYPDLLWPHVHQEKKNHTTLLFTYILMERHLCIKYTN